MKYPLLILRSGFLHIAPINFLQWHADCWRVLNVKKYDLSLSEYRRFSSPRPFIKWLSTVLNTHPLFMIPNMWCPLMNSIVWPSSSIKCVWKTYNITTHILRYLLRYCLFIYTPNNCVDFNNKNICILINFS